MLIGEIVWGTGKTCEKWDFLFSFFDFLLALAIFGCLPFFECPLVPVRSRSKWKERRKKNL